MIGKSPFVDWMDFIDLNNTTDKPFCNEPILLFIGLSGNNKICEVDTSIIFTEKGKDRVVTLTNRAIWGKTLFEV
jgi:hypothetical protein